MSAVKKSVSGATSYSFGECGFWPQKKPPRYDDDVAPETVKRIQEEANKELSKDEWVRVDGFYCHDGAKVG